MDININDNSKNDKKKNGWRLEIAEDAMKATLFMVPPDEGDSYTVEDVLTFLRQNGVYGGILYSAIENMINNHVYYKDVCIAEGRPVVNGVNGYYEFMFQTGQITHPVIRSDGSVDYQSMNLVHSVKKGDKLAIYHHSEPGEHGIDVRGREMRCRLGKEQPALRGGGFEIAPDGITYVATNDGRVEYENFRLYVRDVYEHRGDLDQLTGRIDFYGDVVVHGNVCTGTTIRASKSITVDGSVEAATLIAEGDIILRKGIQGGSRCRIVCGGNLYANFIEFADVNVKGNIEANIIMNSNIKAGKSVKIAGRRGSIVGGELHAAGIVDLTNLGNKAEIKTAVATGFDEETEKRYHLLLSKAESAREGIRKSEYALTTLNNRRICNDPPEVKEAKRNRIERMLKRDKRQLEHVEKELNELSERMEISRHSSVRVANTAYPSVTVGIDFASMKLDKPYEHCEFYRADGDDHVSFRGL